MIVASGVLQGCESLNVTGLEFESRLSPFFMDHQFEDFFYED